MTSLPAVSIVLRNTALVLTLSVAFFLTIPLEPDDVGPVGFFFSVLFFQPQVYGLQIFPVGCLSPLLCPLWGRIKLSEGLVLGLFDLGRQQDEN